MVVEWRDATGYDKWEGWLVAKGWWIGGVPLFDYSVHPITKLSQNDFFIRTKHVNTIRFYLSALDTILESLLSVVVE